MFILVKITFNKGFRNISFCSLKASEYFVEMFQRNLKYVYFGFYAFHREIAQRNVNVSLLHRENRNIRQNVFGPTLILVMLSCVSEFVRL